MSTEPLDISKLDLLVLLRHLGACRASIAWVRSFPGQSAREMWEACQPGWKAWIVGIFCCQHHADGGPYICFLRDKPSDAPWDAIAGAIVWWLGATEPGFPEEDIPF